MKPITTNAQTQAVQQYGHEPVLLVRVDWDSGTKYYGSKDVTIQDLVIPGKILNISDISCSKKQDNVGMVGVVKLTLDDADLSLKTIVDSSNVEYLPCAIYQWFGNLSLKSDMTLIFKGQIVGPIEWSEGTRTLSFEVETRLRDQELGFSADLGSIPYLNINAVDKAWPLSFGNMVHSIALKLITAPSGRLKYPFRGPRNIVAQPPTSDPYRDDTHFTLQDGDGAFFPQGTYIQVQIDGVIFGGIFQGTTASPVDVFTVGEANMAKYFNIKFTTRGVNVPYDQYQDPDQDTSNGYVAWIDSDVSLVNNYILVQTPSGYNNTSLQTYCRVVRQEGNKIWLGAKVTLSENWPAQGDNEYNGITSPTGMTVPGSASGIGASFKLYGPGDTILQVAKNGRVGWGDTETSSTSDIVQKVDLLSSVLWHFAPESEVTLWQPSHKDVYVANLIPASAVVAVYANKRNKDGVNSLSPIPPAYYTVNLNDTIVVTNHDATYTQHPCTITFNTPLKDYADQGWTDQLYVVMRSSVGPNVADVIKYLFDTWSILPTDSASFATVNTQIANYPCGFTWYQKENVASFCDQIAWQARCALIIDNGTVFIKYLSIAPTTDLTFNEDNLELRKLALGYTSTDQIYTYLVAKYKLTHYPALRFEKELYYSKNVPKYGYRKKDIDFFIYNVQSLVQKSLSFWGPRYTNSWRIARLDTLLEGIRLELFDTVALALTDTSLLNTASIQTVVQKTNYNPSDDGVALDLWIPAYAGTKTVAADAWLSDAADTMPADPTLKYAVSAFDQQHPNGESQRRVALHVDGGAYPAIITDLNQAGSPAAVASTGEADTGPQVDGQTPVVCRIDQYGNGFGSPPTKTGLIATTIDPSASPVVGQRCMSVGNGGKVYLDISSTGSIVPAIVTTVNVTPANTIQVDIYANGYSAAVTKANQNAFLVDPSNPPSVGTKLSVFLVGPQFYAINVSGAGGSSSPSTFPGKITNNFTDGTYAYRKVNSAFGGATISAGDLICREYNRSPFVSLGTYVQITTSPDGHDEFFYTLDSAS